MSRRRRSNAEHFSIYQGLPCIARLILTREFGKWLVGEGAELLHVKSPYEVFRYRPAGGDPVILYKKASGALTWSIKSAEDYRAFLAYRARQQRRMIEA